MRRRTSVIPPYLDEGLCDEFLQHSVVDGFRTRQRSRVRAWRYSTSLMTQMRYRVCKTSSCVYSFLSIYLETAKYWNLEQFTKHLSWIHEVLKTSKVKATKYWHIHISSDSFHCVYLFLLLNYCRHRACVELQVVRLENNFAVKFVLYEYWLCGFLL